MRDETSTISDLKQLVRDFVDERNWQPFHDAKNLAASIAIEAAELMEHFQWLRSDELNRVQADASQMQAIREETADIAAYLLSFADRMGIDLAAALEDKMRKNALKYPVEQFRGKFR